MSDIAEFLSKNFHQPYPNKNIWCSFEEVQDDGGIPSDLEPVFNEWRNLNVSHAHKDFCQIKVYFYGFGLPAEYDGKHQSNCTIELYLNSYCTWDTFFEGYISNLETLKIIFNCIGIPYID